MVQPCDDISDFELIRRMAGQESDPAGARIAWAAFYVRHQKNLVSVCMWHHEYLLGAEGVRDLVQDAFIKAFDGAATFNHAEICERTIQQRKCRRWLAKIAENLVLDRYKGQPQVDVVDDETLAILAGVIGENQNEIQITENKRLTLLKAGFDLLSETEQTVLRATMFWWQPDHQHQRMPHEAMERLSKQVDKSVTNIRQIRARAIKELKEYVNKNFHDEKDN
jgi:RNA polymerase sigma factor (sigma-70 family)